MITKEYSGLDIGKFICAILVIAIHTEPFINNIWLDRGVGIITRLAVPFFFMVTGYFFFDGSNTSKKLIRTLNRLIVLYAIWSLIYLPFNWPIINLPVRIFNTGINDHLWYVPAVIFAIFLIYVLNKCMGIEKIIAISGLMLVIGTALSTYMPLTYEIIGAGGHWIYDIINVTGTRNGIFYGFFYVALGAFIREKGSMNLKTSAVCFVIGMLLLVTECLITVLVIHITSTVLWLTCPIAMVGLFGIFKNINIEKNTVAVRKVSSLIYFSHYLWIYLIGLDCGLKLFLLTSALAIVSSVIIVKLSNKVTFLKYLF